MTERRENYYERIDRILEDWVFPLGGLAVIIAAIIWIVKSFS